MTTALVVGAGLAGLVAARELSTAGWQVRLAESGVVGGALARASLDGLSVDVGAEGFATRGGAVAGLAAELGLADRIVAPAPTGTWMHRASGSRRLPDGAVLGIPTIDDAGTGALARDAGLDRGVGAQARSLGDLVRARMGVEVVDAFVRPLIAGVHRLDVDAIAPELLLPGVLDRLAQRGTLAGALAGGGAALAGLDGGMNTLVDALVADLDARGVQRCGAITTLPDQSPVLLACPPWQWPAAVPQPLAEAGAAWPPPRPVDLVTLVLAGDGGARKAGVIVADGSLRARALTYSSAKWAWLARAAGDRQVLRLTYDARPDTDAEMTTIAVDDAAAATGARWGVGDVLASHRTCWQMPVSAVDPAMSDHRERMRAAVAGTAGIDATGGWLAGTGLAWTITDARAAAARMVAGV